MLFAPLMIIYFIQFIVNNDNDDAYDADDADADDDDILLLSFISFQYMLYMYLFNTILVQLIIYEYFHYLSTKLLNCICTCNLDP